MTRTQSRLYCGSATPRSLIHIWAETSLEVSLKDRSCGPARKALSSLAPAIGSLSRRSTTSEPQTAARNLRSPWLIGSALTPMKPETSPSSATWTSGAISGS